MSSSDQRVIQTMDKDAYINSYIHKRTPLATFCFVATNAKEDIVQDCLEFVGTNDVDETLYDRFILAAEFNAYSDEFGLVTIKAFNTGNLSDADADNLFVQIQTSTHEFFNSRRTNPGQRAVIFLYPEHDVEAKLEALQSLFQSAGIATHPRTKKPMICAIETE